mmetsp:Transcript_46792/g.75398  ORF Transcript_46792/g.75398 Transcript_46792/m.75398 type:complete len:213 (-) Transcript_46792:489-1127(-)
MYISIPCAILSRPLVPCTPISRTPRDAFTPTATPPLVVGNDDTSDADTAAVRKARAAAPAAPPPLAALTPPVTFLKDCEDHNVQFPRPCCHVSRGVLFNTGEDTAPRLDGAAAHDGFHHLAEPVSPFGESRDKLAASSIQSSFKIFPHRARSTRENGRSSFFSFLLLLLLMLGFGPKISTTEPSDRASTRAKRRLPSPRCITTSSPASKSES